MKLQNWNSKRDASRGVSRGASLDVALVAAQGASLEKSQILAVELRNLLKSSAHVAGEIMVEQKGFASPALKSIIGSLTYLRKLAGE